MEEQKAADNINKMEYLMEQVAICFEDFSRDFLRIIDYDWEIFLEMLSCLVNFQFNQKKVKI